MKRKRVLIIVICLMLMAGAVPVYRLIVAGRQGGKTDTQLDAAVIPFKPTVQSASLPEGSENIPQNGPGSVPAGDGEQDDEYPYNGYADPPSSGNAYASEPGAGSDTDTAPQTGPEEGNDPLSGPSGGESDPTEPAGDDPDGGSSGGDNPGSGGDVTVNENGEILLPEMP